MAADSKAMKKILVLVLLLLLSPSVNASEDDLERYLPPDETRWLEQGENRYLLLERESLRPMTKGVVIHLPAWDSHPLQRPMIRHLYQELPKQGWTTFALNPPAITLDTDMLQFPAIDERYPEAVSDETLNPLRDSLRQRLLVLFDELEEYQGFIILVAEGKTAVLLTDIVNTDLATQSGIAATISPDALILLDAYLPQYALNKQFARQLASSQLPVFDLITDNQNTWVQEHPEYRSLLAEQQQHISYRQQHIQGSNAAAQRQLLQAVNGWLRYQGF